MTMRMPKEAAERKRVPVWRGMIMYFPLTVQAIARCSWQGNEQHNKGEPLHWAREKSDDHLDCVMRHLLDHETGCGIDDDGVPHVVKAAWRMNAYCELALEKMAADAEDEEWIDAKDRAERRAEGDDDDDGA